MNGDLISRSALLDVITTDGFEHFSGCLSSSEITLIELMRDSITEAPAVDAVEVVRCKDCKHSRERDEHEREYVVEGVVICTHPDCSEDSWFATWADHWCRHGERRDDNADLQ